MTANQTGNQLEEKLYSHFSLKYIDGDLFALFNVELESVNDYVYKAQDDIRSNDNKGCGGHLLLNH